MLLHIARTSSKLTWLLDFNSRDEFEQIADMVEGFYLEEDLL